MHGTGLDVGWMAAAQLVISQLACAAAAQPDAAEPGIASSRV